MPVLAGVIIRMPAPLGGSLVAPFVLGDVSNDLSLCICRVVTPCIVGVVAVGLPSCTWCCGRLLALVYLVLWPLVCPRILDVVAVGLPSCT